MSSIHERIDKCMTIPVSVIVPCFNCIHTIERAVGSIAQQTWLPAEVILIDDCSTDGTRELLHRERNRYPKDWIKVTEQASNGGPAMARNAGWNRSSQPYIAFLDSDDSWHPQKLELQYSWMVRNPDVDLSGHACRVLGREVASQMSYKTSDFDCTIVSLLTLLFSNRFSTPAVMLKTGLPNRFDETKRRSEDYLLWMEIASAGLCVRSALPLTFLYKEVYGAGGLSGDLWKMTIGELDTYRVMVKMRHLNRLAFAGFYLWSMLKHVRRLLLSGLRKQRSLEDSHAP